MKCVQFPGLRDTVMGTLPEPGITNPDDVLIRIGAVGICGSDIHYYTDGRIGDQVVSYPYVPGHECSGTVVAVGKAVTRVKPGEKIAIEPALSCGECDQCRAGRENTCRNIRFLGSPGQLEGCLKEFLVMPERNCFPMPPDMGMAQGAFAEPLSIAIYGLSFVPALEGKSMAILGAGPIGLSVQLEARYRRAKWIYVTDKLPERLDVAARHGADLTGNPINQDVERMLLDAEPAGLDVVVECCGEQQALDQAVRLLKPGGLLLVIGIPVTDRVSFDVNLVRRHEITIRHVRRQNGCLGTAVGRIATGSIVVDDLITHREPMEHAKKLYEFVAGYQDGVIKAVIEV